MVFSLSLFLSLSLSPSLSLSLSLSLFLSLSFPLSPWALLTQPLLRGSDPRRVDSLCWFGQIADWVNQRNGSSLLRGNRARRFL